MGFLPHAGRAEGAAPRSQATRQVPEARCGTEAAQVPRASSLRLKKSRTDFPAFEDRGRAGLTCDPHAPAQRVDRGGRDLGSVGSGSLDTLLSPRRRGGVQPGPLPEPGSALPCPTDFRKSAPLPRWAGKAHLLGALVCFLNPRVPAGEADRWGLSRHQQVSGPTLCAPQQVQHRSSARGGA